MSENNGRGLNVVSLFAGAGGLDIAACATGAVDTLFSTDSQPIFLETVARNLPVHFPRVRHISLVSDARELKARQITSAIGTKQVDLLIGGPPCDDYTIYGRRLGPNGDKAALIFEFSRLVRQLKPRAFLFENVPNLAGQFSSTFEALLEDLSTQYDTRHTAILPASSFGAPTLRKRVFIVGFRNARLAARFKFPAPTHGESAQGSLLDDSGPLSRFTTVRDVFEDLPDVKTAEASRFLNHTGRPHRPETVKHMMTVPQGTSVPKSHRYRAPWEGLCRSLTAGLDMQTKSYIHPIYHREMSVREYARIHGFPDTWEFHGTHHNGIKQVANAVPIQLGSAVMSQLVDTLLEAGNFASASRNAS